MSRTDLPEEIVGLLTEGVSIYRGAPVSILPDKEGVEYVINSLDRARGMFQQAYRILGYGKVSLDPNFELDCL